MLEELFEEIYASCADKYGWTYRCPAKHHGDYLIRNYKTNSYEGDKIKGIAHGVKEKDLILRNISARQMAQYFIDQNFLGKDDVLVPAPQHTGKADYTLQVANYISEKTGCKVADILICDPHDTLYDQKKSHKTKVTTGDLRVKDDTEIPNGNLYFLDNVIATGTTYNEVKRQIPGIKPLPYALSTKYDLKQDDKGEWMVESKSLHSYIGDNRLFVNDKYNGSNINYDGLFNNFKDTYNLNDNDLLDAFFGITNINGQKHSIQVSFTNQPNILYSNFKIEQTIYRSLYNNNKTNIDRAVIFNKIKNKLKCSEQFPEKMDNLKMDIIGIDIEHDNIIFFKHTPNKKTYRLNDEFQIYNNIDNNIFKNLKNYNTIHASQLKNWVFYSWNNKGFFNKTSSFLIYIGGHINIKLNGEEYEEIICYLYNKASDEKNIKEILDKLTTNKGSLTLSYYKIHMILNDNKKNNTILKTTCWLYKNLKSFFPFAIYKTNKKASQLFPTKIDDKLYNPADIYLSKVDINDCNGPYNLDLVKNEFIRESLLPISLKTFKGDAQVRYIGKLREEYGLKNIFLLKGFINNPTFKGDSLYFTLDRSLNISYSSIRVHVSGNTLFCGFKDADSNLGKSSSFAKRKIANFLNIKNKNLAYLWCVLRDMFDLLDKQKLTDLFEDIISTCSKIDSDKYNFLPHLLIF